MYKGQNRLCKSNNNKVAMKIRIKDIKEIEITVDEFESMSPDQIERLQKMRRYLANYENLLKTFIKKHENSI